MNPSITVKFWGVRGSIPSPGKSTVRYGGNTSCVSIRVGKDNILILDAGTGIRDLGGDLIGSNDEIYILLSHNHWDHIQGFPFFAPIYQKDRKIYIFSIKEEDKTLCALLDQMDGAHFPVNTNELASSHKYIHEKPLAFLKNKGFNIVGIPINHHGEGHGYKIENNGKTLIYITDNELDPPSGKKTGFDEFVKFCDQADILIHDAQYIEKDMPNKHGWGHSLASQACELAIAAKVKHLVLFHHDHERTDNQIDTIQADAKVMLGKHGIECTAAYEGLELTL